MKYEKNIVNKGPEIDPQAIFFAANLYSPATAEEITLVLNQMVSATNTSSLTLFNITLRSLLYAKPEVLAATLLYITQKGFPGKSE